MKKSGDSFCNLFFLQYLCRNKAALGNLKAGFHCACLHLLCIWIDSPSGDDVCFCGLKNSVCCLFDNNVPEVWPRKNIYHRINK